MESNVIVVNGYTIERVHVETYRDQEAFYYFVVTPPDGMKFKVFSEQEAVDYANGKRYESRLRAVLRSHRIR